MRGRDRSGFGIRSSDQRVSGKDDIQPEREPFHQFHTGGGDSGTHNKSKQTINNSREKRKQIVFVVKKRRHRHAEY
jgi:hypothetical protein